MLHTRFVPLHRLFAIAAIAFGSMSLSGCGAFFQCEGKASCGTGTGTGSTGNYAYVSNSSTGTTYLNEYSLASGALTAVSGSPVNLGYTPAAMAMAPGNSYMYIAQSGSGLIYEYSIGSTGALSIANGGAAVAQTATGYSSLDVSPDGNWLLALDNAGLSLYEFPITKSSGLLGTQASFDITGSGAVAPQAVRVSPNSNYVACALGTAGTLLFPFSASAGIGSQSYATITTGSTATGDFGLVMDTNNYLYVARTTGPAVYALSTPSTNVVSATSVSQSSLTNGSGPHSIALSDAAGAAVYVGNLTDSNISAYTNTSGKLANLTSVAYTGPTSVSALARDISGKYILAAGYNGASGIQLFTIGSGGALSSTASAASGTSLTLPALIAVTR